MDVNTFGCLLNVICTSFSNIIKQQYTDEMGTCTAEPTVVWLIYVCQHDLHPKALGHNA